MDFGQAESLIASALAESRSFLEAKNGKASARNAPSILALGT